MSRRLIMPWPHILIALLVGATWGANNVVAKYLINDTPPLFTAATRFFITGLLLLPLMKVERRLLKPMLVVALLSGPGFFGFLYAGFALADAVGPMTVIGQLWIPLAMFLAVPLLGETLSRRCLLGVAIALGGIAIMSLEPTLLKDWRAALLILISSIFWALGGVLSRRYARMGHGLPPWPLQAWLCNITWPLLLLASLLFEPMAATQAKAAGVSFLGWSVFAALAAGIVGNGLFFYLLGQHAVAKVTPLLLITPLTAVGLGCLFLDEILTVETIGGTLLVLAGLWLVTTPPSTPPKREAASEGQPG